MAAMPALAQNAAPAPPAQASSALVPPGQKMEFAADIARFRAVDKDAPPKPGQILFVGSSIIREWTQAAEQMAPLPVINRGFGGARTWEVLHYADDIVLPYAPKIIVYYCGSNDINAGEPPQGIYERYRAFSDKIAQRLPGTRIYYLAIFRAPQKKDRWDVVDRTNQLVRSFSARTPNRFFLDANGVVADAKGEPQAPLYRPDGLHYVPAAYDRIVAVVKPVLQEAWRKQTQPNRKPK